MRFSAKLDPGEKKIKQMILLAKIAIACTHHMFFTCKIAGRITTYLEGDRQNLRMGLKFANASGPFFAYLPFIYRYMLLNILNYLGQDG